MSTQAKKIQQIASASVVLIIAITVTWLSYTREPASAFLFPRLISVVFLALSCWNFSRAALGMARVGDGLDVSATVHLIPGLVVMLIYVFWLAKFLGFYVASLLTFFILLTLYDTGNRRELSNWTKRVMITVFFMAIMYGLFAFVLKVQLPRGLFI